MKILVLILAIIVFLGIDKLISMQSYIKYLENEVDRLNESNSKFYDEYKKYYKKWSESNYEKENLKVQNEELMDKHIPKID